MFSQKLQLVNPELEERIQLVTQYAVENNYLGLHKKFPAFNICLQGMTPIEVLAYQGECHLVDWLISDRVGGDPNAAVYGYAQGGYFLSQEDLSSASIVEHKTAMGWAKADELIAKGVSIRNKIMGLVKAGYVDEVNKICLSSDNPQILFEHAIVGYAIAGNVEQVELLLAKNIPCHRAMYGYALGGHHAEVTNLLRRGVTIDIAIHAYAQNGNTAHVYNLLAIGGNFETALRGYANGGHILDAEALISTGTKKAYALAGYAMGKHHTVHLIKPLLEDPASLSSSLAMDMFVFSLAKTGHFKLVDNYLSHGASVDYAIRGYAIGGYEEQIKKFEYVASANLVCGYATAGNILQLKSLDLSRFHLRKLAMLTLAAAGRINYVNELLMAESNANAKFLLRETAVQGYQIGSMLTLYKPSLLRLLALTDDGILREMLARGATHTSPIKHKVRVNKLSVTSGNIWTIHGCATVINKIMHSYKLNYIQASALRIKNARLWILQGRYWKKDASQGNYIISDMYYKVAQSLTGLSRSDVDVVYQALALHLYLRTINNFKPKEDIVSQGFLSLIGLDVLNGVKREQDRYIKVCRQQYANRVRFFKVIKSSSGGYLPPLLTQPSAASAASPAPQLR